MKQQETKTKSGSRRFAPLIAALVVTVVVIVCFVQVRPGLLGEPAVTSQSESERKPMAKNYAAFREEVKLRDQELLDKWRDIKRSRRNPQEPDHARRHYENRLSELESALEMYRDSEDKKGSIGWGLKQDIAKLKSDPAPN